MKGCEEGTEVSAPPFSLQAQPARLGPAIQRHLSDGKRGPALPLSECKFQAEVDQWQPLMAELHLPGTPGGP